jgi:hypothetical protein
MRTIESSEAIAVGGCVQKSRSFAWQGRNSQYVPGSTRSRSNSIWRVLYPIPHHTRHRDLPRNGYTGTILSRGKICDL